MNGPKVVWPTGSNLNVSQMNGSNVMMDCVLRNIGAAMVNQIAWTVPTSLVAIQI